MRVQIIELPTQQVGEIGYESPYLLLISEISAAEADVIRSIDMKGNLDHCAGVICNPGPVQIGPESAYEMQLRRSDVEMAKVDELLVDWGSPEMRTTMSEQDALEKLAQAGLFPERVVDCPERAKGRGCACLVGAEDCPTEDGALPATVEGETAEEFCFCGSLVVNGECPLVHG